MPLTITGKVPKIIEAIRFIPKGIQKGLKKSKIFNLDIDPSKDNLIQILVETRQEIKKQLKTLDENDPEYQHLSSRQRALKILANALSYGIFIELNPEDKKSDFQIYGLDNFNSKENRYEKTGKYFHPLLGIMITSGARLFLAMAEAITKKLGYTHAYMDTDSIFIPSEISEEIIEFFQPLNPYNIDIPLLKPEKEDILFYGIASKRSALYHFENEKIVLAGVGDDRSYKLHGLGHLTNPLPNGIEDWHAEIWLDILKLHYGQITEQDIEEKYSNLYAISRLSVSTPNVLQRFKKINQGKQWKEQIKPFSFFNVGFQTIQEGNKAVKPLAPFSTDSQRMVHEPFIDYQTGEIKQGVKYFKPLSKTILQYVDHPESKFEGDIGTLERKHIQANEVVHIGKEANNIDEQPLKVQGAQIFINEEEIKRKMLGSTPKQARKVGVSRSTLKSIKDRIKSGRKINYKTKAIERLVSNLL